MDEFQQLAAPFPPEAVSWRAQAMNGAGNSAMALAYIDARDVMDRLDAVMGPANWQDTYTETAKGRLICTLSLRIGEEWISKSDGAGNTDVEGDKGAISDALKRAAVKWGIGRYLYDIKAPWADCESYEKNGKKMWKAWTPTGLRKLQQFLPRPDAANVTPIVQPAALSEEPQLTEVPRLTKEQAAIIGAFTGILSGNFEDMHGYVEKIMGRPVFTHEMASKDVAAQIREAARADFKAILPEGTRGA